MTVLVNEDVVRLDVPAEQHERGGGGEGGRGGEGRRGEEREVRGGEVRGREGRRGDGRGGRGGCTCARSPACGWSLWPAPSRRRRTWPCPQASGPRTCSAA